MMTSQPTIAPLHPRQRMAVLEFFERQTRTHQHLNWRAARDWMADEPERVFLAQDRHGMLGVLAFSMPQDNLVWLKLLAIANRASRDLAGHLLEYGQKSLMSEGVRAIYALEMTGWFANTLQIAGFEAIDELLHLKRPPNVPINEQPQMMIQAVSHNDLAIVIEIDHAAFPPPWQMESVELQSAFYYSSHFTLACQSASPDADRQKAFMGYQLSATYPDGVHLARLATHPDWQGRGVGRQLLLNLIYNSTGYPITVNTQATNHSSRRLYERMGFRQTALRTPVWRLNLIS